MAMLATPMCFGGGASSPPDRQAVQLATLVVDGTHRLHATAAQFGARTARIVAKVRTVANGESLRHTDRTSLRGTVAVVVRGGGAPAAATARAVQRAGALGLVLINGDDRPWCPSLSAGDNAADVRIPVCVAPASAAARLVDGADVSLAMGDTARDYTSPREATELLEAESSPHPISHRRSRSRSRSRVRHFRRRHGSSSSSGSSDDDGDGHGGEGHQSPRRAVLPDERAQRSASWHQERSPSPGPARLDLPPSSATPKRPPRRRRQEQLLHSVQRALTERPPSRANPPPTARRRRHLYADSDDDEDE